jgi:hypothetical protein
VRLDEPDMPIGLASLPSLDSCPRSVHVLFAVLVVFLSRHSRTSCRKRAGPIEVMATAPTELLGQVFKNVQKTSDPVDNYCCPMTFKTKYKQWFELGAARLRGWASAKGHADQVPDDPVVYLCPLCLRFSIMEDLVGDRLTVEDVPPKSVGGKPMVLTCRECNNDRGGSKIDSHAAARERFVDSATGVSSEPIRGELGVGDLSARGDLYLAGGGLGFVYKKKEKANNLKEFEALRRVLHDPNTHRRFSAPDKIISGELANLSYIRAAYLASFAAFGWTHIFREVFKPLRDRLTLATDADLPDTLFYDPDETSAKNEMLLVTEPGPQNGLLLVSMSRAQVVLPGPDDGRSLEQVAAVLREVLPDEGGRVFKGRSISWPTWPTDRLDPEPPSRSVR